MPTTVPHASVCFPSSSIISIPRSLVCLIISIFSGVDSHLVEKNARSSNLIKVWFDFLLRTVYPSWSNWECFEFSCWLCLKNALQVWAGNDGQPTFVQHLDARCHFHYGKGHEGTALLQVTLLAKNDCELFIVLAGEPCWKEKMHPTWSTCDEHEVQELLPAFIWVSFSVLPAWFTLF